MPETVPALTLALAGLAVTLCLAVPAWAVASLRHNVSLVDRLWSMFFVAAAAAYTAVLPQTGTRAAVVWVLLLAWALRLSAHITWRGWGEPEDRRYAAMRERHQPGFVWKSLVIVFVLQAVIAWAVSAPLAVALASDWPWGASDFAAVALVVFGIVYESVADLQLARFQRDPACRGQVMDRGLWRWSRHPNYFGESCVWWGFGLLGAGAGQPWTLLSPLLMTWLLLRVSGITLMEDTIVERRPGYREYVRRTNAFVPGPRRGDAA